MKLPWLPPGRTMVLAGRGEIFYRHSRHPDPSAPTLLLLHGWTANADTQFFSAYEALAEAYSFVAPDHRGHGRGFRAPFTVEDVADDAAALVRGLGIDQVVTVGYSMGGPISLLVADRHPGLVAGLVVQATAMEWRATRLDRIQWRGLPVLGWLLRSRWLPYLLHRSFARLQRDFPAVEPWLEWLVGETRRNDPHAILEAARSLSHFDAGPWAGQLGLPAGMLITTKDRLVKPRQQRPLAAALGARIEELAADHLCTMTNPAEYSAATRRLVDDVVSRSLSQPLVEVLDLEVGSTPNGPAAH